jgi:hypothetical protein
MLVPRSVATVRSGKSPFWVTETLADRNLGRQLAAIERDLSQHHAAALERARRQIVHAIDSRYSGAGDQER